MTLLGVRAPGPPGFELDWDGLVGRFECLRALEGCPQSPRHHAEGDVLIHTRMVVEALLSSEGYRALDEPSREVVFAAALLHDVAKPAATREELGELTSRGHSGRGEVMARRLLWELEADLRAREHVCQLVRLHELPFFAIDEDDGARRVIRASQIVSCELLSLLAEADARGRRCLDQQRLLDQVTLFAELCREQGCLDRPFPFANDHGRVEYFRRPGRDPLWSAHDDTRGQLLLLCGLPGAGKDHWARLHEPKLPAISLDELRKELGARPTGRQGEVIHAARERARASLRRGEPFLWNATNLSRKIRSSLLALAADYNARTRIVYVEVGPEALSRQNRERPEAIPEQAYHSLLARWQVPDRTEAHQVEWNGTAARWEHRSPGG